MLKSIERLKRKNIKGKLFYLGLILYLGCGSRMPPPGKPDLDPPIVRIVYPAPMDTVKGTVYVKYTYEDKSPLLWVALYVDGKKTRMDSSAVDSIPFTSDSLYDDRHSLMIEASDKWDNIGKSQNVYIITLNGNKKEKKDEGMDREHKGVR